MYSAAFANAFCAGDGAGAYRATSPAVQKALDQEAAASGYTDTAAYVTDLLKPSDDSKCLGIIYKGSFVSRDGDTQAIYVMVYQTSPERAPDAAATSDTYYQFFVFGVSTDGGVESVQ